MRFVFLLAVLSLAACVNNHPPALSYYDTCAEQSASFLTVAACGKAHRNTACEADLSCSPSGNAAVAYADSLVISVRNHEMSEAEAQRKWIEYRLAQTYSYDEAH